MKEQSIYVTDDDHRRLTEVLANIRKQNHQDQANVDDLQHELERAVVMPSHEIPYHVITMHSQFLLKDLDTGDSKEFTLVYPSEANFTEGKLSILAPVGTALLGSQSREIIEWDMPAGRKRFRVEAIYYQPEAAEAYRAKADGVMQSSRSAER